MNAFVHTIPKTKTLTATHLDLIVDQNGPRLRYHERDIIGGMFTRTMFDQQLDLLMINESPSLTLRDIVRSDTVVSQTRLNV